MRNKHTVTYNQCDYIVEFIRENGEVYITIDSEEYRNPTSNEIKGMAYPYSIFNIILQGIELELIVYNDNEVYLVQNGKDTATGKPFRIERPNFWNKMNIIIVPFIAIIVCGLETAIFCYSKRSEMTTALLICYSVQFILYAYAGSLLSGGKMNYLLFHPTMSKSGKLKRIFFYTGIFVLIYILTCIVRAFLV